VSEGPYKIVYLTQCIEDEQFYVIKFFTPKETDNFVMEVERHMALKNHKKIIKAIKFVPAQMNMSSHTVNGVTFDHYSYLVFNYCKNDTLISMLLKASGQKHKLSMDLIRYLFK